METPMSRTILIVDDNPEERGIFAAYLHFVGARLLEAADGADGLAIARDTLPDLILLDLTMPVMDGWEMIRHMQADESLRTIPVVAITAHHLDWERLEREGFCGYLEKPLSPHAVLLEVERCLGPLDAGNVAEPSAETDLERLVMPRPVRAAGASPPAPEPSASSAPAPDAAPAARAPQPESPEAAIQKPPTPPAGPAGSTGS